MLTFWTIKGLPTINPTQINGWLLVGWPSLSREVLIFPTHFPSLNLILIKDFPSEKKKKTKMLSANDGRFECKVFWMLKKWKERLSGGGWKGGGSLIEEKNYNWRFLFGSVKLGAPSLIEPFICISGYFWSKWLRQGGRFWNQPGRTLLAFVSKRIVWFKSLFEMAIKC